MSVEFVALREYKRDKSRTKYNCVQKNHAEKHATGKRVETINKMESLRKLSHTVELPNV